MWLVIGWSMVMFVVVTCMLPAPVIEPVAELLWDKAEHALAFFGMTLWFCGLYPASKWRKVAIAFLLLGIGIELAQGAFTTTRAADVHDAICAGGNLQGLMARRQAGVEAQARMLERLLPGSGPRV